MYQYVYMCRKMNTNYLHQWLS